MRKSIATVSVSGTLPEKLAAIAQARFHGVEIFESDLVNSPFPPERIRWQAADLGLAVELYQPFRDFEAMPPGRFAAGLKRAEHKFDVMERLGADTMLVCSNVSPDDRRRRPGRRAPVRPGRTGRGARPDDRLRGTGLGQACPRVPALVGNRPGGRSSGARGVPGQLSYPLPWLGPCGDPPGAGGEDFLPAVWPTRRCWPWTCCSGLGTIAASRARAASTCPASWNTCWPPDTGGPSRWRCSATPSARPSRNPRLWTRCARCCTWRNRSGSGWSRAGPAPPRVRGRFRPGRSSCSRRPRPQSRPRRDGRTTPWRPSPWRPSSWRSRPAPFRPGLAFAEIAAVAADAPALSDTLRALGFTRQAAPDQERHPVASRRGEPRPEHRPGRARRPGRVRRDPQLTALGLRTTDSPALADRAEQYLAPVLPRRRGSGEADLPSIRTPAGTTLLFCQHDDEWLGDFIAAPGPAAEPGRRRAG